MGFQYRHFYDYSGQTLIASTKQYRTICLGSKLFHIIAPLLKLTNYFP